jgi:bacteriocin biosynthesis cyclodehydratase domain-containing protein
MTDQLVHNTHTRPEPSGALLVQNPAVTVIRCSDNEVMVRMGSRSRVSRQLKDDGRRGILAEVVERFALPLDPVELVAALGARPAPVAPTDVEELVSFLRANEVLVELTAAESSFLTLGLALGDASRLLTAHVGVIGDDELAGAVLAQLADAGVGRFSLLGGLDPNLPGAVVETVGSDAGDERALVDLFDASDLVVVAGAHLDLALAYSVNSAALQSATPWALTHVDGPSLVVGPLFRPFETACFNDFDTQEEAGRTLLMEHLFYKSQLEREGLERRRLPRFVTDLGAALSTIGVVQALSGRRSLLEGTVVRYDLERLEVVREVVMRLPRCPACVAGNPDYRHPFL